MTDDGLLPSFSQWPPVEVLSDHEDHLVERSDCHGNTFQHELNTVAQKPTLKQLLFWHLENQIFQHLQLYKYIRRPMRRKKNKNLCGIS